MKKRCFLVGVNSGISQKSGNPYCMVNLRSKKDGRTILKEFFVPAGLISTVTQTLCEDIWVDVDVVLNDSLNAEIASIVRADAVEEDIDFAG